MESVLYICFISLHTFLSTHSHNHVFCKGVRFALISTSCFLCYLIIYVCTSNRGRIAAFIKRAHEPFAYYLTLCGNAFRSSFRAERFLFQLKKTIFRIKTLNKFVITKLKIAVFHLGFQRTKGLLFLCPLPNTVFMLNFGATASDN